VTPMPSTIASLAAELKAVHTVLNPIAAAYNSAFPSDANHDALKQAFRKHSARAREIVSAMVDQEPESARDALILALVVLDFVASEHDGNGGNYAKAETSAANALVQYLAREAGIAPAELGIFGEVLALAELEDGAAATAN